jgi:hypothetical protein
MTVVAGRRRTVSALLLVIGLLMTFGDGCRSGRRASSASPAPVSPQALRTCVDRWNEDNMLGWGPTLVSISARRLDAREQEHVGVYDRRRRCTASLAVAWPRDLRTGCSGYDGVLPGYPKFCVSTETTFVCVLNTRGGYFCSRYADGAPPLKNKNGTTNERGVLKLDVSLPGTHATPRLVWQRRYPHVDGFIHPWTKAGKLRRGLTFAPAGGRHFHGRCFRGTEFSQTDRRSAACRMFSSIRATHRPRTGTVAAWSLPARPQDGQALVAS